MVITRKLQRGQGSLISIIAMAQQKESSDLMAYVHSDLTNNIEGKWQTRLRNAQLHLPLSSFALAYPIDATFSMRVITEIFNKKIKLTI